MSPALSAHFSARAPSAIRRAQILFARRADAAAIDVINVAIGNISLPMHPAMQERMRTLAAFQDGVVKYTASAGTAECQRAILHTIRSCGADVSPLQAVVTDGGSQAMELMILGVCGPRSERPLLLLDPAYTNYMEMARRSAAPTISLARRMDARGNFAQPDLDGLAALMRTHRPAGIVVIPADNPTGQLLRQESLVAIARLAVEHDLWLVSDEAYRQLSYGAEATSVWKITEAEVPGITGRRIGIESASKVWNACGLRIGALVSDNGEFRDRAVAEYTANLCANAIGQYIFAALAEVPVPELTAWYQAQRAYYRDMMTTVRDDLLQRVPGITVSCAEAAVYSVVELQDPAFDAETFVTYCATQGNVRGRTLLLAPMAGFYGDGSGKRQMRIAFVEPPERMALVPELLANLLTASRKR
jgi:aspartate aminotransferase